MVITNTVVWPKDKDGNIIKPSWWEDEEMGRRMRHRPHAAQGTSAAADAMNS